MAADSPTRVAAVLAAGLGTRMRSRRPKVLHAVGGRPLLGWVLASARAAGCERIVVVVGHGADEVRERFAAPDVTFVHQREQRGTGHALAQVAPALDGAGQLLVLSGDVPLVSGATLGRLASEAAAAWGAMAVADLEQPGSLGRVAGRGGDLLDRIVEVADATPEELAIRRVNAGLYALPYPRIFDYLEALEPDNAKGELYLTDALGAAAADGHDVRLVPLEDPSEALGVNDRRDLLRVHRRMLALKAEALQLSGVTLLDPRRTTVEPGVEVGPDTVIHGGVELTGATRVGESCVLLPGVWVRDSSLADGVVVEPYSVLDGAEVGPGCRVGPFARLRPGTVLETGSKVGNFVEVKKSRLGPGVKASHLAYLGDATVGEGANIGAGTVTCNYDGLEKHPTEIGREAFIGSDSMLVAPVKVGDGAITDAGSVITHDVPPGALAVERARQRNVEGWAARRKKKGRPSRANRPDKE